LNAIQRIATAAALTLGVGTAQAANVTWANGPGFIGPNGHLGILTNGSLVQAVNLRGSGGPSLTVDPAGINLTFSTINSSFFNTFMGNGANSGGNTDPAWAEILGTAEWQSGSDVTATGFLGGLTSGHQYQVQLFSARNDNCCGRTHWFGDSNGHLSSVLGDNSYVSVVGTFTADAASQTLQFFDSSHNPYLNAYVLRDITSQVPDPGSWALMLGGMALLGSLRRSRA
jgi:MYXO-CTERM domain-containing protein